MTQPELMTTAEVSSVFRCTPRTLWNWRRDGRIQAVKVGRDWRYRQDEIERLCGASRPSTTTQMPPLAADVIMESK